MKLFLLGFLLIVATCRPVPASDNKTIYKTAFIMQWASDCVQQVKFHFMQQGMPLSYALMQAGMHCSCVIDEFRLNYTQQEVISMTPADRQLFSEYFARKCVGDPNASI